MAAWLVGPPATPCWEWPRLLVAAFARTEFFKAGRFLPASILDRQLLLCAASSSPARRWRESRTPCPGRGPPLRRCSWRRRGTRSAPKRRVTRKSGRVCVAGCIRS